MSAASMTTRRAGSIVGRAAWVAGVPPGAVYHREITRSLGSSGASLS